MRLFLQPDSFEQRINSCNELSPTEVTALVDAVKRHVGQHVEGKPPLFRATDLKKLTEKVGVLRINGTNLEMRIEADALSVSPVDTSL